MDIQTGGRFKGKKTKAPICSYCGEKAVLCTGETIYPHRPDLSHLKYWVCEPCGAYVGCHKYHEVWSPNGDTPFGILANKELRSVKITTHTVFDAMWKNGEMTRLQAYRWLATELGIKTTKCHIGLFTLEDCGKVIDVCMERTKRGY